MIKKEIIVFIICLIIAFIWWVIYQLNQVYVRQYNTNVIINEVPILHEKDSIYIPVRIKVKGSGLKIVLLENYFPERIVIPFKKLRKLSKKGLYAIESEAISENEQFPVKIKVIEIQPDTIHIGLKYKKRK